MYGAAFGVYEVQARRRLLLRAPRFAPAARGGGPTMSRITEAQPPSKQRRSVTTIELEIEVQGRWDALALSELLIPFHPFLVQHDHDRWTVHARAPGCHGEPLPDALEAIDDWRADRHPAASCRVGGRPYQLAETRVA
jgi:hypothetical protein